MKKLLAIAMSLTFMVTAFSCGTKPQNSNENMSEISSISISQTLYKEEKAEIPVDYFYSIDTFNTPNGVMLFYADKNDAVYGVRYDENNRISEKIQFERNDNDFISNISIDENDNYSALCTEIFNDEETYEILSVSYNTYDSDGRLVSSNNLGDVNGHYNDSFVALNHFSVYGDELLFSFSDEAVIIDLNGNVKETAAVDNNAFYTFDKNGSIIFMNYNGCKKMNSLSRVADNKELTEYPDKQKFKFQVADGGDDFSLTIILSDGIYGMTSDEQFVKILDSQGSKINLSEITHFASVANGRFFCAGQDLCFYNVRPDDYVENREKVVVAVQYSVGESERDNAIEFEKQNDDYEIEYREYEGETDAMKLDILKGDAPDVYYFSEFSQVQKYANLGALGDIDELSEKYGGINSDYFLDNVNDAMKYKGKLYAIPEYFKAKFDFAKRDVISRKYSNWTLDEFYSFAENMPDNMYLGDYYMFNTPTDVFEYLCAYNITDWVDFENSKCNFNNEDFIKMLEFCRNVNILEKQPDFYYSEENQEQRVIEEQINMKRLYNNEALLKHSMCTLFDDFLAEINGAGMTIDEITFINKPNESQRGTIHVQDLYTVLNCGNNEKGGWEFFNYIMSFDRLTRYPLYAVPPAKEAFDYCMEKKYDNIRGLDIIHTEINGVKFDIDSDISKEDFSYITDTMKSCSMLETYDSSVTEILFEEFNKFISDESTSEQCAENIQTRTEILLSERK